jgi:hypothetical protein
MKVYEDIDAQDFRDKAWSGAADTLEDLTDEQIETVMQMLEDGQPLNSDGEPIAMSLTELNDFFWFDRDTIAEWLGYSSYEQLMERGDKGNEYFDDTAFGIKLTHGEPGVDDDRDIAAMLDDFMDNYNGDFEIYDDSDEDYSDEEERYVGSVIVNVSEAMLDYLKDNGVSFDET